MNRRLDQGIAAIAAIDITLALCALVMVFTEHYGWAVVFFVFLALGPDIQIYKGHGQDDANWRKPPDLS